MPTKSSHADIGDDSHKIYSQRALPERDYAYILDHMLRGATIKKAKASSGASKDDVQFTGRTYKKLNGWRNAGENIYGAGKIHIPHTGEVEDRIIFLPGSVDGDKIVPMEHEMGDIEEHFVDLSTNHSDTLAMIVKHYSGFNMYKISRVKPAHATRNSVAVDIKTTTCLDKIKNESSRAGREGRKHKRQGRRSRQGDCIAER
jgi:hypothetical protein